MCKCIKHKNKTQLNEFYVDYINIGILNINRCKTKGILNSKWVN